MGITPATLHPTRATRIEVPPAPPRRSIAPDCRHYRGDRPCIHNRLCRACPHYAPHSHRLCIIKLGALGDVVRTLCILPELRRLYPDAHITWISRPAGCRMIRSHPRINRVLAFDPMTVTLLSQETFDLLISLDKEPEPCALAMALFARRKLGIGLSEFGTPVPINAQAVPYFELGLSDELKFHRNRKSYPQLIHEALGLTYRRQRYELPVDESLADRMRLRLAAQGWSPHRPTVGINVGAGARFVNKMWSAERQVDLIEQMRLSHPDWQVLLLGGPEERAIVDRILLRLSEEASVGGRSASTDSRSTPGASVFDGGTEHDEPGFVALVDVCDVLFSGDTMAMHVAIARGCGVVAFFGPTCEQEVDLYGLGEKLVARVPCGPCYRRSCHQDDVCVRQITTRHAVDAIARVMHRVRSRRTTGTPGKTDTPRTAPPATPLRKAS